MLVEQNLDAWFSTALRDGFSVHLLMQDDIIPHAQGFAAVI